MAIFLALCFGLFCTALVGGHIYNAFVAPHQRVSPGGFAVQAVLATIIFGAAALFIFVILVASGVVYG